MTMRLLPAACLRTLRRQPPASGARAARGLPILAVLLLCLVLHPVAVQADDDTRPNIVLIMADDMGYECVGANGGTSYATPHLDRMAETGLRFTNAHSQPICTPTRVQIMTGLYNHRNYIRFGLLDPGATTFAHVLKRAGYTTCIAGKWQLKGGMEGPGHFGFDEYCLWQLTRRPSRFPNPGLEINGKEIDYNDGEYGPDIVSDYLCDFIERNRNRPFFAYYPMILPHWPFEPTPDSPDWDPSAEGIQRGHGKNRYFADMVTYTDKMVGKIFEKLDALGLRENTLVIFTGDNGTYTGIRSRMGNRKVKGGKGKTTDNGTHVPFIASWPGTIEPDVADDLVDFTDILPTLADLAVAERPADIPFDGYSLVPVLK
ncbi:MAG: sulfatase-like hydrolase/transferase [Maioricimonas sp. JB049]